MSRACSKRTTRPAPSSRASLPWRGSWPFPRGRYPYGPHSRCCCFLSSPAALQGEGGLQRGAAVPAVLCRLWRRPLWGITPCNRLARTELLPAPGAVGRRAGGAAEVGEAAGSADPPNPGITFATMAQASPVGQSAPGPAAPGARAAQGGRQRAGRGCGGQEVVVAVGHRNQRLTHIAQSAHNSRA